MGVRLMSVKVWQANVTWRPVAARIKLPIWMITLYVCAVHWGLSSALERILSVHWENIISALGGYRDLCGGYHKCIGGISWFMWGISSAHWGVPQQYCYLPNALMISPKMHSWYPPKCTLDIAPNALMILPQCKDDIPQYTDDIPSAVMTSSNALMISPNARVISPQCSEHP